MTALFSRFAVFTERTVARRPHESGTTQNECAVVGVPPDLPVRGAVPASGNAADNTMGNLKRVRINPSSNAALRWFRESRFAPGEGRRRPFERVGCNEAAVPAGTKDSRDAHSASLPSRVAHAARLVGNRCAGPNFGSVASQAPKKVRRPWHRERQEMPCVDAGAPPAVNLVLLRR